MCVIAPSLCAATNAAPRDLRTTTGPGLPGAALKSSRSCAGATCDAAPAATVPTQEALMTIKSHFLAADVMRRWPATIRVFLDFRMGCVGCPIASFHDIGDACREHGTDQAAFLAALS